MDSEGAQISRGETFALQSFVKTPLKPTRPCKKRRGRRPLSCTSSLATNGSGQIYFGPCQNDLCSSPCTLTTPSSCLQTSRRPCCSGQGYQHPDHGHPLKPHSGSRDNFIEPHSGICSIDCCTDHTYFYCHTHDPAETLKIEETQTILDGF